MGRKKKKISKADFDRLIKIWSLIVPIIVALIVSLTTLFVSYGSKGQYIEVEEVRPTIAADDQLKLNRIIENYNREYEKYHNTFNEETRAEMSRTLTKLAREEATIRQLYYPKFVPRWPPSKSSGSSGASRRIINITLFTVVTTFVFVLLCMRGLALFVIRRKFDVESSGDS